MLLTRSHFLDSLTQCHGAVNEAITCTCMEGSTLQGTDSTHSRVEGLEFRPRGEESHLESSLALSGFLDCTFPVPQR